jgi:DNA-binding transcriptional regulator GbsR (MarR family)
MDYKNEILNLLREQPMSYAELKEHFGLTKDQISNYLTSLKKFKLIAYPTAYSQQKNQKYVALNFTDDYHDFVKKYTKENSDNKKEIEFNPIATTKVSSNDYHTKGSHQKRSVWIGTTFGTMEY